VQKGGVKEKSSDSRPAMSDSLHDNSSNHHHAANKKIKLTHASGHLRNLPRLKQDEQQKKGGSRRPFFR
jgi:hypothetical protein